MAKLKVLSAGAVEGPLAALVAEFTRASGVDVDLSFSTVGDLKARFVGGEAADVIALSMPVLQTLEREGRFVPGSVVDLGRASCGVAIRDGFLLPNIATAEAFKKALLNARSVAQTDPAQGGSSGIYFAALLERIGIADEMKDRLIYGKTGRDVGLLVRNLRAELGVTFTSEFIPIEGLRVIGPFPKEYEYVNAYGAAISRGGDVAPAKALLAFLSGPAAKPRFQAFGLE
jgi:molybdate transport system substrate-binding protein